MNLVVSYDASQQGKTFIPDNAFEQKLIDLGYDDIIDNFVDTELIQSIQSLNLSASNINDLTGIESFSSLTNLNVSGNGLFFIDTYSIPNLQELNADNNLISGINTFDIPNIQKLSLNNNQLTFIDVSNNSNLVSLRINSNSIESIDLSTLTSLGKLEAINTDISCISVSEDQLAQIPQGWKINGAAFYSTNCGFLNEFDSDNDGIQNDYDLCPGTPDVLHL